MSVSNGPNLGKMINALDGDAFGTDFRKLLRAFDVLVQPSVKSKTLTAPPGSPTNGDRYIVGSSPTGAWSGKTKNIAVWTTDNPASPSGVWEFYAPNFGWMVPNLADGFVYVYDGTTWTALSGGGGGGSLASLSDVLISSPTLGQILTYNGTDWVNGAGGGGSGANVNGDTHPVSPSAFDDEFEGGSLAGIWTQRNSPSLSFSKGSIVFTETGSGSDNWQLITQSIPSSPYQAGCKIFMLGLGSSSFSSSGLILYETSSGKFVTFGLHLDSTGSLQTNVLRYNSFTSGNSSVFALTLNKVPDYFSIKDDGTNRLYQISFDGIAWITVYSESRTAFITPDHIGVGINAYNTSALFSCDWFRSI